MTSIVRQTRLVVTAAALITATAFAAPNFPSSLSLPNGWLPEGIVAGRGTVIYSGSRANGGIFAVDARTGEGAILVPGQPGRVAVGLDFDRRSNYIYVAGGATGTALVYDADTGAQVAGFQLTTQTPVFINDVIVTREAVYFTNSNQSVIYSLPLGPGGRISSDTMVETIPLSGAWSQVAGTNANGIEATANGDALIIVNSALGMLYRVDPTTGVATLIDLGTASMTMGDGLLLEGHTLYVVRNRLNRVEVIDLEPDLETGTVVDTIISAAFDIPTTITRTAGRLYAVNARFTTPPSPSTTYNIVQAGKH